jgi:hypothetical protein
MKILLILIVSFGKLNCNIDINDLRNLFLCAANDPARAKQLMRNTENEKINNVVIGYYGASKMLMAKYYFNPYSKWNSFKAGRKILEAAIRSDPFNAELRFLRLSIQKNAPWFLGYNENVKEDQLFLNESSLDIKDEQLKTMINKSLKRI